MFLQYTIPGLKIKMLGGVFALHDQLQEALAFNAGTAGHQHDALRPAERVQRVNKIATGLKISC